MNVLRVGVHVNKETKGLSLKILYQDTQKLPRGRFEFYDEGFCIKSISVPQIVTRQKTLFIRGTNSSEDRKVTKANFETEREMEEFLRIMSEAIEKLNEKYNQA